MKKFLSVLILGTVLSLPFGLSASDTHPVNDELIGANCTIDVDGFKATGNCRAVLRAYKKWKEINPL